MPAISFKGRKYILRWRPEWDSLLKKTIKKCKNANKRTDWKKVIATGILKIIPVSLNILRQRPSYWKPDNKRKEKNRICSRKYNKEHKKSPNRLSLLKFIVKDEKGTKAHSWNKKQKRILFSLAKKYKEETFIDWKGVLEDPKSENFPCRNREEISKLYYRFNNPKKFKYSYPKSVRTRYLKSKIENMKKKRELIWNFLYEQSYEKSN